MTKKEIINLTYGLAKSAAREQQVDLWDVDFEKEGGEWRLRVLLDKLQAPVTIDKCEQVSRTLSRELDRLDPIEQSYILEVSSAGLGRKLRKEEHFQKMLGEEVTVKTFQEKQGKKEFVGILHTAAKDKIEIHTEDGRMEFLLKECAYVKLNDDLYL